LQVSFNGGQFEIVKIDQQYLKIDPRGHFAMMRCAAIMFFDKIMQFLGYRKPFAEFCEFFANYPTW
jgi:hypothetical protein